MFLLASGCETAKAVAPPTNDDSAGPQASQLDTLPFYDGPSFRPRWLTSDAARSQSFHAIPPFELTNQAGETITGATFRDKIYVTNFFFTSCPGICPKLTKSMHLVQEAFAHDDDVLLLSHSVTPDIDTVDVLGKYAQKHAVRRGKWHLVTGDRERIYNLGRSQYFVEEDLGEQKSEDDFLHTENLLLVDRNRRIRGIYNGLRKADISQLVADVKTLQREG